MRDGSADFKKPSIAASGMWFLCSAKEHQLSRDLQRSLDEHGRCVRVGLAIVSVALCKRVLELRIRIGQRRIRPQSVGISNALGKAFGGHGTRVRTRIRWLRPHEVSGLSADALAWVGFGRPVSLHKGGSRPRGWAWVLRPRAAMGRTAAPAAHGVAARDVVLATAGATQAGMSWKSCPAGRARPRGGVCPSRPR